MSAAGERRTDHRYDSVMLATSTTQTTATTSSEPLSRLATVPAWLVMVAVSGAVGWVLSFSPALATAHLALVVMAVLAAAVFSPRPEPLLMVTIYAGLCDVLWRASSARGPWEASKWLMIVGFAALIVRFVRRPRHRILCTCLILLLVPGTIMAAADRGFEFARKYTSASVGGLVALALAVMVCSSLRLSQRETRGLYVIAISPTVSMAAQATLSTVRAGTLNFTDEVNFDTSGGFGPNQVSSVLCVGGLLCILVLLQRPQSWMSRLVVLATAVWIVGQAVLTFSRGGLFGLVLAAAAVGLVALVSSGQRFTVIITAVVLVVVAVQVLSWVGAFTGGASEERLSSTDSTNRVEIAESELRIFARNPIFGTGVGTAKDERDIPIMTAPHTEYTRLLAEHGVFGLAAIAVLATLCVKIFRSGRGWSRMAAAGLMVMALAQMAHSATRIGSIAVCFGLAALIDDDAT